MRYQELLDKLKSLADENYRNFHSRLLNNDKIKVLGVKVPTLRKIAKENKGCIDELLSFPDEFYEVTFIKLCAVALLDYESFIKKVDLCVGLIDNWATCDCFAPKCISSHKAEFLPYFEKYLADGREFYQRFALTTLLHFYVEKEYLTLIFDSVQRANNDLYYVHMASAWLIAEILTEFYDEGVEFLSRGTIDIRTHNKAIQKACESYRITKEKKIFLKDMKK